MVFMASGFLASIYLARHLDPGQLGAYFLLIQVAAIGGNVSLFGTNTAIQRFVSVHVSRGEPDAVRKIMVRVFFLIALAYLSVSGVLALFWPTLVEKGLGVPFLLPLLPMALVLIGANAMEQIGSAFFRASRKTLLGLFFYKVPSSLLFLGALVLSGLLGFESSLIGIAWMRSLATLVSALGAVFLVFVALKSSGKNPSAGPSPSLGELTSVSAPMALHMLVQTLLASLDLWILGFARPVAEVGVYGAMQRLAILFGMGPVIVNLLLPPILASLFAEGRIRELESINRRVATVGLQASILLVLGVVVFGHGIIHLVYGPGFESGFFALLLLGTGVISHFALGSPGWMLQMTGHQVVLLRITFYSLLAGLGLGLIGVWLGGMTGVAGAACLTLIGKASVSSRACRRLLGVRTYAYWDRALQWDAWRQRGR